MSTLTIGITVTAQPVEVEPGYFLGTAVIGGASHHLELFAVDEEALESGRESDLEILGTPDGTWLNPILADTQESKIEDLMSFAGACGEAFEYAIIDGQRYIVAITPYCD